MGLPSQRSPRFGGRYEIDSGELMEALCNRQLHQPPTVFRGLLSMVALEALITLGVLGALHLAGWL